MNMLNPRKNDYGDELAYSIKVRGLKYLWGSAGLIKDIKFEKACILHIVNDLTGEPIKIGTQMASGTKMELGTIQPGECISISVNEISGIYADCNVESLVHCFIY